MFGIPTLLTSGVLHTITNPFMVIPLEAIATRSQKRIKRKTSQAI
jgi:hypothetical protein